MVTGNSDYLLREHDVARRLAISVAALRRWRRERRGPRYRKLGRAVRYLQSDVNRWLEAHAVDVEPG